jgi:hypothetical protein
VKYCLRCLQANDNDGMICDTCEEKQSPHYKGLITGRDLIRALRSIGAVQILVAEETTVKDVKHV